jgi:hypothetical protein
MLLVSYLPQFVTAPAYRGDAFYRGNAILVILVPLFGGAACSTGHRMFFAFGAIRIVYGPQGDLAILLTNYSPVLLRVTQTIQVQR